MFFFSIFLIFCLSLTLIFIYSLIYRNRLAIHFYSSDLFHFVVFGYNFSYMISFFTGLYLKRLWIYIHITWILVYCVKKLKSLFVDSTCIYQPSDCHNRYYYFYRKYYSLSRIYGAEYKMFLIDSFGWRYVFNRFTL